MKVLMWIDGLADGLPVDAYLSDFDFTSARGLKATRIVAHAKVFDDAHAALNFWRTVSPTAPVRPDGNPNRPLTAYTITLVGEQYAADHLSSVLTRKAFTAMVSGRFSAN